MNKKHIKLTHKNLIEKIIANNRGGFCFELNGLFADLLKSLGFVVYMTEAAVYNQELGAFGFMRNHMTLLVTLNDELYLTDVGFGDSFRHPISLKTKYTEDVSGKYRIVNSGTHHYRLNDEREYSNELDFLVLEHTVKDTWRPQYKFHYNTHLKLTDYQDNCNWIQTSTDSGFTKGRTWTLGKPDGRVSLSEGGITETRYDTKTKIPYSNDFDFDQAMRKYLEEIS
jgi:N-hydroxyarylamine O-acetyltransferase